MFRQLYIFLSFGLMVASCQPKYKKCTCSSKNEELKAYSEVINEIVDHRSYNFYLGEDEERIYNDYMEHPADTARIDKEVIRLQNKIFNDTSRFCTIYLDTAADRKFKSRISGFQYDTSQFGTRLRSTVREISNNPQSVLETVGAIQTKYLPKDFILCTSKMKIKTDTDTLYYPCCIGVIRLSKISFNSSQNKGLLYYEFAGRNGSLLVIEKAQGRWIIKSSIGIWQF